MIIFENVRIIELAPETVSAPVDVAVDGNRIAAIGQGLSAKYPGATRESPAAYVSAGLVCSHNHFYSALARGLMVDIKPSKDFGQQLAHLWWRLDRALDEQITRYSGLSGAADAVMSGVTSVIDHHASPEFVDGSLGVLKEAFEAVGLRGILCYETTDRNGKPGAKAGIRENVRFAKAVDAERTAAKSGGETPLVEAAIGAHAGFTLDQDTVDALGGAVRDSGRGLHTHAAEDRFDASDSRHRFGADLAVRFDRAGCLGPKSIVAHGLYLSKEEMELLNERDSFLAHNARSNMNNFVGYNTLLPKYRNSVLGTDGIGSDMLQEAAFAFFKHRDAGGPLWPPSILAMLDRGNRILDRYFSADGMKFGRVESGCAADLVFWDYDPPTPLLDGNLGGHVMFGMTSRSVHTVMINGKFVVRNREPQFDSRQIFDKSREQTRRLWKRMEERK
ncbi:MAG TPA: putative aminohydrolase SsnA [Spirochaetia bacterium]|nr:putative aminohydrolase SsnA [Spirochaetia bacterium]